MEVSAREVREWLDKQIVAYKAAQERLVINDNEDYLSNIGVQNYGIHMSADAVRYVAEKLDIDLCVKSRKCAGDYPYEVFIIYNGVVFFDIESEADYQRYGEVI